MVKNQDIAARTAALLLQIKAIKLQPQDPFTWASGIKSPIYCDNRITLSYPEVRAFLTEALVSTITAHYKKPDVIAGVATGAIGIGMLVAHAMDLPFIYVRPEAKKHGRKNQIEGFLPDHSNVVVIEDLISTGNSSLNAVAALKDAGATINGMVALFSYGFNQAQENFQEKDIELITLSDYDHLIEKATSDGLFNPETITLLKSWRENPSQWNN